MERKTVTLFFDPKLYKRFKLFCLENDTVVSRELENFMKLQINQKLIFKEQQEDFIREYMKKRAKDKNKKNISENFFKEKKIKRELKKWQELD